jgi:UTP-glucose-1-phosphate uridylyltransferase
VSGLSIPDSTSLYDRHCEFRVNSPIGVVMYTDSPRKREFRTPKVAILLAAGLGKRQRPLTHLMPKPLLCFENRPLIDYAMNALAYCKIKTIYVVTNYLESQIIQYLEKYKKKRLNLVFCHQETIDGTANAVNVVKKHVKSIESITDYVVISAADYVFSEGYIKALIDFHALRSNDISVSLRAIDKKGLNIAAAPSLIPMAALKESMKNQLASEMTMSLRRLYCILRLWRYLIL